MYAHIIDGKINGCGQCRILGDNVQNIVITDEIASELDKYIFQDGEIILNPNYEQEQAQKEHQRIMELSMTRSDFFDGTIKAFGADSDDLLVAVQAVVNKSDLSDIEKKVAVNNYKNALNFYRKHPLFSLLTAVPVGDKVITLTSEQWDRFFDETDKGNAEAYKALV
jgi:hypothetical protein